MRYRIIRGVNKMKINKKTYMSLAGVAIVALVVASVLVKSPGGKANAQMRSNLSEDINIPVSTVALEKGQLEDTIFAVGSVEPSATYEVNAKVNGEVNKVLVNIGDTVKEGDILFTMKDDTFTSDKASTTQNLKNQMDLAKFNMTKRQRVITIRNCYLIQVLYHLTNWIQQN